MQRGTLVVGRPTSSGDCTRRRRPGSLVPARYARNYDDCADGSNNTPPDRFAIFLETRAQIFYRPPRRVNNYTD